MSHVRGNTQLGKLMINTLSQLQLFSGQHQCLLAHPQPLPKGRPRKGSSIYRWNHLGQGWLLSLRGFLHHIGGRVVIPGIWTPQLTRVNDEAIMDAFRRTCDPTEYEMALANSVRLYLRVLTVADIADYAGRNITAWAREGRSQQISSLQ